MKKLLIFLCMICTLSFCGCNRTLLNGESAFLVVEHNTLWDYAIVYHKETKVMYSVSTYGEFTVLVNPDGTPLLYAEE